MGKFEKEMSTYEEKKIAGATEEQILQEGRQWVQEWQAFRKEKMQHIARELDKGEEMPKQAKRFQELKQERDYTEQNSNPPSKSWSGKVGDTESRSEKALRNSSRC